MNNISDSDKETEKEKEIRKMLDELSRQSDYRDQTSAGKAVLYARTHQISPGSAEHLKAIGEKAGKRVKFPPGILCYEDLFWMAKAVAELQEPDSQQSDYLNDAREFTRMISSELETDPGKPIDTKVGRTAGGFFDLLASVGELRVGVEEDHHSDNLLLIVIPEASAHDAYKTLSEEIAGILQKAGLPALA